MKTKFGKSFKRVLSTGLTAALLASFAAFAPVTSFAAIQTENVLISNDFATSVPDSWDKVATYTTDDAEHGGVMKLAPVNDAARFVGFGVTQEAGKRVMIDFDFKANTTDFMYRVMFNNNGGRNLGHIVFGPSGQLILSKNGGTVWGNISTDGSIKNPNNGVVAANYEANKWYRMTAVINPTGNKDAAVGHQTSIDYYLDGKHLLTSNTDLFKDNATADPSLDNVYMGTTFKGEGTIVQKNGDKYENVDLNYTNQHLLVDNLSVRYADTYTYLQNDDPVVENNSVKIKFSETLAAANTNDYTSGNDLSAVKIKSIDGKEATGVTVTVKNEYLTVNYGKLDSGKTYYVVLPKNFKSADEKVLESNAIPFTAPVSGEEIYVYNQDFEDVTIGANIPSGWTNGADSVIGEILNDGEKHGNIRKFNISGDTTRLYSINTSYNNDSKLSDTVVFSTDIKLNEVKRTANLTLRTGVNGLSNAFCFIDGNGRLAAIQNKNHAWSQDETVSETNTTYILSKTVMEANKWYTIKIELNNNDNTVVYYFGTETDNGKVWEKLPAITTLQDSNVSDLKCLRFEGWDNANQKTRSWGNFSIDNTKLGYKVEPNVIATADNNVSYDFSSVVDNNQLDDKYLFEADIKISDFTKPVYFRTNEKTTNEQGQTVGKTSGLVFKADDNGNLYMSKSLLNWAVDVYMTPLNVKINKDEQVNIKLLVNKNATKEVSVLVNDKYVRSLSLGWGNEGNGTYADKNVGADEFVHGDNNNVTGSIVKTSIYNFTSNQPADIVLTDSTNKNYNIFDGAIPADIASVTVKYNTEFADGTNVSGAKLQVKGDGEALTDVTDYTATLSADKKSIVIAKEDGVLANGTYVITVSGVNGADNFKTEFTVNDSRNLTVTGFKVTKDGTSYYPELKANNYSTADKKFTVIICEYSNNNVPKLNQIGFKEVTVSGSGNMTINKAYADANGLTLTNVGENSTVKAFVWDTLGSNIPLINAVSYVAE